MAGIKPVVLYGYECWADKKKDEKNCTGKRWECLGEYVK